MLYFILILIFSAIFNSIVHWCCMHSSTDKTITDIFTVLIDLSNPEATYEQNHTVESFVPGLFQGALRSLGSSWHISELHFSFRLSNFPPST